MDVTKFKKYFRKISLFKTLYYRRKFRCNIFVGKDTELHLDNNSKIIVNGNLFIGIDYNFPQKTIIEIGENGELVVDGPVSINRGCRIVIQPNARLKIGKNSFIGENSKIKCCEKIVIGENCLISWNVNLIDSDVHHVISDNKVLDNTDELIIKDKVWVGFNSIILKGVTIGESSVVGAGTVVTKSIPENCLTAGNPNKIIRDNIAWKK